MYDLFVFMYVSVYMYLFKHNLGHTIYIVFFS